MGYALLSDHIKVYLTVGETRLSLLLGGYREDVDRPPSRSALQNPEMNRHELGRLLRRQDRQFTRQPNGWTSFFAANPARCANSNVDLTEIS